MKTKNIRKDVELLKSEGDMRKLMWYSLVITLLFIISISFLIKIYNTQDDNQLILYNVTYVFDVDNTTIINYSLIQTTANEFFNNTCRLWAYNDTLRRYSCSSFYIADVYTK